MATSSTLPTTGIPSSFDRADGINPGGGGIAETPGSVMMNTATGNTENEGGYVPFFYETSDSPQVESGEQSTIVHKFNCDYLTAIFYMTTNPRGTYMTDHLGNTSRVLSSRIDPVPRTGMRGVILTVTSEGQYPLFPNPPEEFDVETVELNPALEKHPRYGALTYNQRFLVRNANLVDDKNLQQQYENLLVNISASSPPGTPATTIALQITQSQEMLFKQHKGEDSFYLAGYKITYSTYFWSPQFINPGGYIEDPVSQGGLPYLYWSTTGTNNPQTSVFAKTAVYNQNLYAPSFASGSPTTPPFGLSWLRQADTLHLNRTWWKLTKTWIGGPIGVWDNELYNQALAPYQTKETQGSLL